MSALMFSGLLAIWFAPQATSNPPRAGVVPPAADANWLLRGSGSHGGGGGPPPSPPDGNDVQVSSPSTAAQQETELSVDPSDRLHLVGAAFDARGGPNTDVFYSSFDGGLTWNELYFPLPSRISEAYDPTVAIGPSGETYLGVLGVAYAGKPIPGKNVYVGRSFDGGLTVPTWAVVDPLEATVEDDRPNLAVDPGPGPLRGAVYATWTRVYTVGGSDLSYAAASFDGGLTWSPRKRFSDSDHALASAPAVGPNSQLYVAYFDVNDNTIKFDVSTDGGVTWGTDVVVANVTYMSKVPHTLFRAYTMPWMSVDTSGGPYNGTIYVCWAEDDGTSTSPDPNAVMSKSTDGGATWSLPVPVSDVTTNSQFMPSVSVDVNGNVNFGFYDRRDDPHDVSIRYYVSRSSDGGATFQPNVAVSDKSFNTNQYSQGSFIGDTTGVAASDRTIHALWTDGRNGDNDIFTSRVQLDMHTDVASISAATGGAASFTLNPGPLYQLADYRILGSISGTTPGLTFNGVNLPVNYDLFMLITALDANSSALPGFTGTLDATGTATAALVTAPLPPSVVGLQMDFAAFVRVGGAVRWASDPTHLEITP